MSLSTLFTGIADAIREKDGSTEQINAHDIPKRIFEIPGNVPGETGKTYTGAAGLQALFNDSADSIRALDGSTANIVANTFPERIQAINVTDLKLAFPEAPSATTYTGSVINPTFPNYNSEKMNATGTTGINAGNYTATFALKQAHYRWADGSKTKKNVLWSIAKAAGSLTLDKTSMSLSPSTLTGTITVMRPGDGAITATSSNTGIVTVSVSENIITVTAEGNGNATITVNVAEGSNYTSPESRAVDVSVRLVTEIYGAEWDGTSTTKWSRTDAAADFADPVPYVAGATSYGSPFDNIQPWAGMVKSERSGGTMVAIPKFWYKLSQNGATLRIQIADSPVEGFVPSPAHMDKGDGKGERDVVYIGRYHCGQDFKSSSGSTPKRGLKITQARTYIHYLGDTIWQNDFAMRFTIWLLYIVEFADWNSQACIGYGCGSGNSTVYEHTGYTDTMPYHTGTMKTSRTEYGASTQYRNIEGLWDGISNFCDGCYHSSTGLMIILNPSHFGDSSGGVSVGTPSKGYPSAFSVKEEAGFPMFIPVASDGNEMTASCDSWISDTFVKIITVGGHFRQDPMYGMFYVGGVSANYASGGSRIQELP